MWGNLIKRGAYYVIGLWYEVQVDGQHYILLDNKQQVFNKIYTQLRGNSNLRK